MRSLNASVYFIRCETGEMDAKVTLKLMIPLSAFHRRQGFFVT